jgi:alkyl hydroperoxide reductase subunit AhpC
MSLRIGDVAPDFEADTTQGRLKFHDWIGDGWTVLFSHPKDFTPYAPPSLATWPGSSPSSTRAASR